MNSVKQIFSNKVTRNAILFSCFIMIIFRMGSNIVTPGVDNNAIAGASVNLEISTLFDFFGGGSLSQMGLFALGVSPYITSSVMIQLLESDLVPAMSEWKHQGVDGQNKRSKWTKNLAMILAFIQGLGILVGTYLVNQFPIVSDPSVIGYLEVALLFTAGCAVVTWLGDRITEIGVGNGISVLIVIGILAQVPREINGMVDQFNSYFSSYSLPPIYQDFSGYFATIWNVFITNTTMQKDIVLWIGCFIVFLLLIIVIIYYSLGDRRIPINYVRGQNTTIKENSYLPIKLNPAGVIPIIFVQPFLLLLNIGVKYAFAYIPFFNQNGQGWVEKLILSLTGDIQSDFQIPFTLCYLAFYGFLIIGFTIIYSSIQMNPEEMSKNLQNQQAYIVNVRPGSDTVAFLNKTISKTSIWGGIILFLIAAIPTIIDQIIQANINISLLGTGLIIAIGVIVQTYQSLLNKSEKQRYRRIIGA